MAYVSVFNIFTLLKKTNPAFKGAFKDYGCAGAGTLDENAKTLGKAVDQVDQQIRKRKHCVQCAAKDYGSYRGYRFNLATGECGMSTVNQRLLNTGCLL